MKHHILLLFASALLLGGCYNTGEHPIFRVPTEKTVLLSLGTRQRPRLAIMPFADNRGHFELNRIGLAYIPFYPLGWSKYDRIERRYPNYFQVSASDDITRATAACFTRSGLFQSVNLANGSNSAGDADYVLSGSIENMRYSRAYFTYGVSIFAPLSWVGAAPVNASMQRLDLRLTLQDRRGRVVWTWRATERDQMHACVQGAYYNKYTYRMYGRTLVEHVNKALVSLQTFFSQNPLPQESKPQSTAVKTSAVQPVAPKAAPPPSPEQIRLKQLLDAGTISKEEFERLSKRIHEK